MICLINHYILIYLSSYFLTIPNVYTIGSAIEITIVPPITMNEDMSRSFIKRNGKPRASKETAYINHKMPTAWLYFLVSFTLGASVPVKKLTGFLAKNEYIPIPRIIDDTELHMIKPIIVHSPFIFSESLRSTVNYINIYSFLKTISKKYSSIKCPFPTKSTHSYRSPHFSYRIPKSYDKPPF